jgi:hypothetical protein
MLDCKSAGFLFGFLRDGVLDDRDLELHPYFETESFAALWA